MHHMKLNLFKQKKQKLVNRGLYFVSDGEYKGCFVLSLTELNTEDSDVLHFARYPEGDKITLSIEEVETHMSDGCLEFVELIPKKIYKVCLGQLSKETV